MMGLGQLSDHFLHFEPSVHNRGLNGENILIFVCFHSKVHFPVFSAQDETSFSNYHQHFKCY